jgi:endonuclease/exonuclease/phosphatase family metal-dependent hydrolase
VALAYGLSLLAIPLVLRRYGDHWWPTTVFMFGPRWVLALPYLVLLPLALVGARRLVPLLLVLAAACVVLVLGFNVPVRHTLSPPPPAAGFRLMTWNVGGRPSGASGQPVRVALELGVQVVVLQECQRRHLVAPTAWQERFDGGECLLSAFPILRAEGRPRQDVWKMGGSGAIQSYELDAPGGPFALTNVHLETPREGFEAIRWERWAGVPELEKKNAQRRLEARLAREWAEGFSRLPRIVAGDFNMTADSAVFREAWGDFRDAFEAAGLGFGHTKRTRLLGVRIDHVLVDPSWRVLSASVVHLEAARGLDHRPLVVELARKMP